MPQDIVNEKQNLSYTNLDFPTIYTETLDMIKNLTRDWDPSISNESDPGVVLIKLASLLADKCNYNIDKSILEAFPLSVTQESNARQLYEQLGYYMHWYQAAKVPVMINYKQTVTDINGDELIYKIPRFSTVSNSDDTVVYTLVGTEGDGGVVVSDGTLYTNSAKKLIMTAYEGIPVSYTFNGKTTITSTMVDVSNRLYFSTANVFENGIFINNVGQLNFAEWHKVNNIYENTYNEKRYKFGYDSKSNLCYIEFPDNYPELFGGGIEITYLTFSVEETFSDVPTGYLSKFFTDVIVGDTDNQQALTTDIVEVKNITKSEGHKPKEGINEAYTNYKKTVATFNTLITLRDYANYIRSNELDICSNAVVSDRTSDIQDTYKIINIANGIESLSTEVTKRKDAAKFVLSKDKDIDRNKYYYIEDVDGGFSKVETPSISVLNSGTTYYELVREDSLTPFSLKFYLLDKSVALTSFDYNQTFAPVSSKIDMDSLLENSSHLVHSFENIEPVEFDSPLTKIMFIKNKYPINVAVFPYSPLSDADRADVTNNIIKALYDNLDSSQIEFGTEVSSEYISNIILNSDTRISSIQFIQTGEKNTMSAVYYDDYDYDEQTRTIVHTNDGTFKEVEIPNSISDLTIPVEPDYSSIPDTELRDAYLTYLSEKLSSTVGFEIICKSILSGATQLIVPSDNFSYHINQHYIDDIDNLMTVTSEAKISIKDDSDDFYLIDDGNVSQLLKTYTLQDNETLTLFRPSFLEDKKFLGGVHYDYRIYSDIFAGQSYQLTNTEMIIFYTPILGDSGERIGYTIHVSTEGSIVEPSMMLPANSSLAYMPSVINDTKVSSYSYDERRVEHVNRINASAVISNSKIPSNDSIVIKSLNRFEVTSADGYEFLWVLNKTTKLSQDANQLQYKLFDSYDPESQASNEQQINTYTLKHGESLYYVNKEHTEVGVLGAGTTIYRECGIDTSSYLPLNADTAENPLSRQNRPNSILFVNYNSLIDDNALGSGISTIAGNVGPNKAGLYEYDSTTESYFRSLDGVYNSSKTYYVMIMKDTSGLWIKSNDSWHPSSITTSSVFTKVDFNKFLEENGYLPIINPSENNYYEEVRPFDGLDPITDTYRLADIGDETLDDYIEDSSNKILSTHLRYSDTQDTSILNSTFIKTVDGSYIDTTNRETFNTVSKEDLKGLGTNLYTRGSDDATNETVMKKLNKSEEGDSVLFKPEPALALGEIINTNEESDYFFNDSYSDDYYEYEKNSVVGKEITSDQLSVALSMYDLRPDINYVDKTVAATLGIDDKFSNYSLQKFEPSNTEVVWGDSNIPDDAYIELSDYDFDEMSSQDLTIAEKAVKFGLKDAYSESTDATWVQTNNYRYRDASGEFKISGGRVVTESGDSHELINKYYTYIPIESEQDLPGVNYYVPTSVSMYFKELTNSTGTHKIPTANTANALLSVPNVSKSVVLSPTKAISSSNISTYFENITSLKTVDLFVKKLYDNINSINDIVEGNSHYMMQGNVLSYVDIPAAKAFFNSGESIYVYNPEMLALNQLSSTYIKVLEYDTVDDTRVKLKLYVFNYDAFYKPVSLDLLKTYSAGGSPIVDSTNKVTAVGTGIIFAGSYHGDMHSVITGTTLNAADTYYIMYNAEEAPGGNLSLITTSLGVTSGAVDSFGFKQVTEISREEASYQAETTTTPQKTVTYYKKVGDNNYQLALYVNNNNIPYTTNSYGNFVQDSDTALYDYSVCSASNPYNASSNEELFYIVEDYATITIGNKSKPAFIDNLGEGYYVLDEEYRNDTVLIDKLRRDNAFYKFEQPTKPIMMLNGTEENWEVTKCYDLMPQKIRQYRNIGYTNFTEFVRNCIFQSGARYDVLFLNDAAVLFDTKTVPDRITAYYRPTAGSWFNSCPGYTTSVDNTVEVYTLDTANENKPTKVTVLPNRYIHNDSDEDTTPRKITINGKEYTNAIGGFVKLADQEIVEEGVEYYLTNGGATSVEPPIKQTGLFVGQILHQPQQGASGTSQVYLKKINVRDNFFFSITSDSVAGDEIKRTNNLLSKYIKSNNVSVQLNKLFETPRRYWIVTTDDRYVVSPDVSLYSEICNQANSLALIKRAPINMRNYYKATSVTQGINPKASGYYMRIVCSPYEWNQIPYQQNIIYDNSIGVGLFAKVSDFSASSFNTKQQGNAIKVYTKSDEYYPIRYASDGVTDLTDAVYVYNKTTNEYMVDYQNYVLKYSYNATVEKLSSLVSMLSSRISSFTTGIYYMPHYYSLGEWYKLTDKVYYEPVQYAKKVFDAVNPFVCTAIGKDDIANTDILNSVHTVQIQPNTRLFFTENKLWTLTSGDKVTVSVDLKNTGLDVSKMFLPTFDNDEHSLDLDSYSVSYQRKGDSPVELDSLRVQNCQWRAYSNLLLNINEEGQKLLPNHTLTFYEEDNTEHVVKVPSGENAVYVQLKYPVENRSGENIDIYTYSPTQEILKNSAYVYSLIPNTEKYTFDSHNNLVLNFNSIANESTSASNRCSIFVKNVKLKPGDYIVPINGRDDLIVYCNFEMRHPNDSGSSTSSKRIPIIQYTDNSKDYFLGNKTHFGLLSIPDDFYTSGVQENDEPTLLIRITKVIDNPKDVRSSNKSFVSISSHLDWLYAPQDVTAVSITFNDIYKFKQNDKLSNDAEVMAKIIKTVDALDVNNKYAWTHIVNNDDLIIDPLDPEAYWRKNHPYNQVTISQMNTASINTEWRK